MEIENNKIATKPDFQWTPSAYFVDVSILLTKDEKKTHVTLKHFSLAGNEWLGAF